MGIARSPHMNVMMKAADKAMKSLRRDFGEVQHLQVSRKGPGDFVSAADLRSEEIIKSDLTYAKPEYSLLLEESGKIEGTNPDYCWIVDPLDGTTNFLHGIPQWAISIALEERGEIIAGLVMNPVLDEIFWAEKGIGAFLNNKRIRVSGRTDIRDSLIAMGTPGLGVKSVPRERFLKQLTTMSSTTVGTRRMGAASLDMAYVAAGKFDAYWEEGLKPWDVAAGSIIVKEAGGFVSEIDGGKNPIYGKTMLASSAVLREQVKDILNGK